MDDLIEIYYLDKFEPKDYSLTANEKKKRHYLVCPVCLKSTCTVSNRDGSKLLNKNIPKIEKTKIDRILVKLKQNKFEEHYYNCRFRPDGDCIYNNDDFIILKSKNKYNKKIFSKNEYQSYFERANALFSLLIDNCHLGNFVKNVDYFMLLKVQENNLLPVGFTRVYKTYNKQSNTLCVIFALVSILPNFQKKGYGHLFLDKIKDYYVDTMTVEDVPLRFYVENPNEVMCKLMTKLKMEAYKTL